MVSFIAAAASVALMTLFIFGTWRYLKRIRDGRADPIIDPSWTSNMRPASPPPHLHHSVDCPNDRA